jgi:hypothetical protein
MRPLKKYNLKASRRPKQHSLLSGVVHVADTEGTGLSYFSFSEDFVDAVGRLLPFGLLPENPGYIKVMYMATRKAWRIFAYYLVGRKGVLLWEQKNRPDWVSNVIRR